MLYYLHFCSSRKAMGPSNWSWGIIIMRVVVVRGEREKANLFWGHSYSWHNTLRAEGERRGRGKMKQFFATVTPRVATPKVANMNNEKMWRPREQTDDWLIRHCPKRCSRELPWNWSQDSIGSPVLTGLWKSPIISFCFSFVIFPRPGN